MSDDTVLLVHGYMDDATGFHWDGIEKQLLEDGYTTNDVHRVSFPTERGYDLLFDDLPGTSTDNPEHYAKVIDEYVDELYDDEGDLNIIAHSMGGLAAREYVEDLGGEEDVDTLVTLGTPHQGTLLASLGILTKGGRAMLPCSRFMRSLNEDIADDVEYVNVWSEDDKLIQPSRYGRLPENHKGNVTEIEVDFEPGTDGLLDRLRPLGYNHVELISSSMYDEYKEYL